MTTIESSESVEAAPNKSDDVVKQNDQEQLPQLSTKIRNDCLDPMELLTQRAIAIQLKSLNIDFTDSALEDLFDLVTTYMHGLLEGLQKITQTQRRSKASPKDLKLLLREHNISTGELEDEFIRYKKDSSEILNAKKELETAAKETFENTTDDIDPQDPSFVFFAVDQDLTKLIPPQHKRIKSIPRWLPEFPPDHTYRRTPKYLDRLTDQKVVRQKVVEESKLGEQALENLIKYGKKISAGEDDNDVDNDEELLDTEESPKADQLIKEKTPTVEGEKVDIWSANEKKFDIQKYAAARIKFYKDKEEKKAQKLKSIDREYFDIVAKLSAYGPDDTNESVSPELYLEKEFKRTLHSLKSLKRKKAKRQIERERLQEEEDRKRDELKAQRPVDFNDFDNFDNFDNFENFDTFGSNNETGIGGDDEIHFEGVDVEEEPKSNGVSKDLTEEQLNTVEPQDNNDLTGEAPETDPTIDIIQNPESEEVQQSPQADTTQNPESEETQQSLQVGNGPSEAQTTAAPPTSSGLETTNNDDEDQDEDEDMFDDVPIG